MTLRYRTRGAHKAPYTRALKYPKILPIKVLGTRPEGPKARLRQGTFEKPEACRDCKWRRKIWHLICTFLHPINLTIRIPIGQGSSLTLRCSRVISLSAYCSDGNTFCTFFSRNLKNNYQYSNGRQKRHQNLPPVLVIISNTF